MNRWESYILYNEKEEIGKFWQDYYRSRKQAKVLFLLGKGFDPRMNNIISLLLDNIVDLSIHVECITFDFPAPEQNQDNIELYNENSNQLEALSKQYGLKISDITINTTLPWEKRIAMMSRQIAEKDLSIYDDFILDVSSLPRAFYFNIAKVIYNKLCRNNSKNLFFAVSENVEIDKLIEKHTKNDDIEPLRGFKSMLSMESHLDRINILIPLIGESKVNLLKSIYNHFKPSDMFPVLPFPSKDPRRSDSLLREYHNFFIEKKFVEPQNITYADERNPFELYRIVASLMEEHKKTLMPISQNVCFGLALLTSKLLSLGALLLGLEYNDCVAIYNVSSRSYTIKDINKLKECNSASEPFLMWVTGDAYNEE